MKKAFLLSLALILSSANAFAAPALSTDLGGTFINYKDNFLTMGLGLQTDLGQNMEFELGTGFGIFTVKEAAQTSAAFLLPLTTGFNFLFPAGPSSFVLGIGVAPTLAFGSTSTALPLSFYVGPFLKAGYRLKVHPVMSLSLNAQQDLLIGGQNWINTGTRLTAGVIFDLGPAKAVIPNQVAP